MNASDNRFYREPVIAADGAAERDLAEAIYAAMVADQALDHAEQCWHIHSSEPLRTRLALVLSAVASAAIDTVLARRVSEAARTGPWDAP